MSYCSVVKICYSLGSETFSSVLQLYISNSMKVTKFNSQFQKSATQIIFFMWFGVLQDRFVVFYTASPSYIRHVTYFFYMYVIRVMCCIAVVIVKPANSISKWRLLTLDQSLQELAERDSQILIYKTTVCRQSLYFTGLTNLSVWHWYIMPLVFTKH